jgi:two-component sensor histidine kinase
MSGIEDATIHIADAERLRPETDGYARELEEALAQKTALLHEVDHRVKNNLQLISSLLQLQSRKITDEATRQTVRGILERVNAIGAVHRRLFQGGDVQRFDVADFVRDLAGDLAASARRDDIQLKLDLEAVSVPASQAAPLALVVNELMSNALKHAFPEGRPGIISVTLLSLGDRAELTIADDGVGMPADQPRGFGLTIVQLLCQQLKAQLSTEDAAPGLRTKISIPLERPA